MMKITLIIFSLFTLFALRLDGQTIEKEVQFVNRKVLPFYWFKKKNNPLLFQGIGEKKKYFEGWYFKMVSKDANAIISVIPGISLSEKGDKKHAFIQIINGKTAQTYYFSFPIEAFIFSKKEFAIRIGENYFSKHELHLNLSDSDYSVKGTINMTNITPYKIGKRTPAIMGWYRFVPFMECYHGVGSLTHDLNGSLKINDNNLKFDGGKGYLEKDWGKSMPKAWIWIQSNHFSQSGNSFMLSIANIPWLGKSFTGFLGFFKLKDKVYRFATYTKAELKLDVINSGAIKINLKDKKRTYLIEAENNQTGMLKAPVQGAMDRRIAESIDARLKMTILNESGEVIYRDSSKITGLEMVGDINLLTGKTN